MGLWSGVDPNSIGLSWAAITPTAFREITLAQVAAAAMAEPYVRAILGRLPAGGTIRAEAFAGVASDGRSLASLLQSPVARALVEISTGVAVQLALDAAAKQLGMIVGTQIQDAGRVADGAGVTVTEGAGYIRHLRTPSCSRCVVLAGKFYRWNIGFQRHPRCDCTHTPVTEQSAKRRGIFDPAEYFASLTTAEQDRTFTAAGAQAIRDGADIGQVVNARRGMTAAGTTEGTRRGQARLRGRTRLMPEQIYAMSSTRADAVTALRTAGFVA